MKGRQPKHGDVLDLKNRHGLTWQQMAARLYGINEKRLQDWASGRRDCPPLAWWAMVLEFEGVDLRGDICEQ